MSQFPALDELVRASEASSPQVAVPLPALVRAAGRTAPRSVKRRTRLTATPDFASPVSENANGAASSDSALGGEIATQDVADTEVVTRSGGESRAGELTVQSSAGGQE